MYHQYLLKPAKSSLWVECRVYLHHADMLKAIRKDMKRSKRSGVGQDTLAFCSTYPDAMPKGRFAIIYFCKKHLTIGTVAHEFIHASLALLARRKVKQINCTAEWADENEETLCELVGSLTDSFKKGYGL